MAVETGSATAVDDSAAVQLSSPNVPFGAKHFVTIVNSGSDTIWVGEDNSVTAGAATAFPLAAGGTLSGELIEHEELWGRCDTGESSTFDHLRTGV